MSRTLCVLRLLPSLSVPLAGEDGELVLPAVFKTAVSMGNHGEVSSILMLSRHYFLGSVADHGCGARFSWH